MKRKLRAAFTIVELLVVIGIIAMLIAILLPTLGMAQRAARTVKCASNLRTIMQGVHLYAAAYKGAFPGSPFTSGAHVRRAADAAAYRMAGVANNSTDANCVGVVSFWDWVSPIAKAFGYRFNEGATANDRRDRYIQFLQPSSIFMCPENTYLATAFGTNWGTLPAMSYTTSIDFMLRRNTTGTTSNAEVGQFVARPEWNLPSGYAPKMSKIGSPSKKAYLTEGTRFTQYGNPDFTYNSTVESVQMGGSHTDQRLFVAQGFQRSRHLPGYYGDLNASRVPGSGRYVQLSYRHGAARQDGPRDSYKMNIAFFDGHVETLAIPDTLDPNMHSPRGTVLHLNAAQVFPFTYQKYNRNLQTTNFIVQ